MNDKAHEYNPNRIHTEINDSVDKGEFQADHGYMSLFLKGIF